MMKLWFWLLSWFPGAHPCSDPDCGPEEDDHDEDR